MFPDSVAGSLWPSSPATSGCLTQSPVVGNKCSKCKAGVPHGGLLRRFCYVVSCQVGWKPKNNIGFHEIKI